MSNRFRSDPHHPLLITIMLIGVVLGGVIYYRETRTPAIHDQNPLAPATELSPDERAYYDYVGPRLHGLVDETQILADMGTKRSRNVLVLEKTYNKTTALIDQIQQYETTRGVPAKFASTHEEMTLGIDSMTTTMANAETLFFRLQWDKLQPLLTTFEQGHQHLVQAAADLDRAGGKQNEIIGTPIQIP